MTTFEVIAILKSFAKYGPKGGGASTADLAKIADVAEDLAIGAEEREEDRLADEVLKRLQPRKGDVIKFRRVTLTRNLEATVLKTPAKGSRRIYVELHNAKRCPQHIMIKRIVGVVSRAKARR